jgi:protocatechuate 3,4-dioxygenase beta subunit
MYFEGDPLIAGCPIVNTIRDERAIRQLIAQLDRERSVPFDLLAYRFDLVLRGVDATWFEAAR